MGDQLIDYWEWTEASGLVTVWKDGRRIRSRMTLGSLTSDPDIEEIGDDEIG